jgi:transcription initiation factor TFIIA small subunit
MQGSLETYRFCDNVWTFILDDVTFNTTGPGGFKNTARVGKLKIVACEGKTSFGAADADPSSKK